MTLSTPWMPLVGLAMFFAAATVLSAQTPPADALAKRFEKGHFQAKSGALSLPYRLLKPRQMQPQRQYPLVLFMHGAGERGQDNDRNIQHGVQAFATDDMMERFPAFIVAPQCGDGHQWVEVPWGDDRHVMPDQPSAFLRAAMELVDDLRGRYPIDPHRIYVTGLSMGGFGVWDALQRKPNVFAAAVPVCGGGDPHRADAIKPVPIWAFHGAQDGVVKPSRSREMVSALRAAGAEPRYTEYPDVGHNAWDYAYADAELFAWLFRQRRTTAAEPATLPGTKLATLPAEPGAAIQQATVVNSAVTSGPAVRREPAFTYRTSWVGNTFGGKDGVFVQMDARTLFTAPDGTCYLNVVWEEDGNNAGLYRGGRHISNPGRTHGWGNSGGYAVVANSQYVYIAQSRHSEGGHLHQRDPESYPPGDRIWFGLTRRTVASGGKEAAPARAGRGSGQAIQGLGSDKLAQLAGAFLVINDEPLGQDAHIRGLALDNTRNRLYVSNPAKSRIEVYHSETLEKLDAWSIEDTRQMAVGPDGSLWVVVGKLDPWGLPGNQMEGLVNTWAMPTAQQLRGFASIVRFSPSGTRLPQVIEDAGLPTGLAFDPRGQLLVADNGPDQQVRIFNVSGQTPSQVGTFGERGGIYAGVRGEVAPLKFNGLQGVGSDSRGNIYVVGNGFGGNGSGITLESYTPAGHRNWVLHGLEFVDVGDFDRESHGENIFTPYERFQMDYSRKAHGSEWQYAGFTLDRERFPYDPRLNGYRHNTAWIRTVNGQRFMYGTDMYSGFVTVYRFEKGSQTAIACGMFMPGTERKEFNYPPQRPEGRFIWVDHNGDGQFDANEFEHDGRTDPRTWAWWVDSRGHLWQGYQNAQGILEFPVMRINEHGVPVYSRGRAVEHAAPAPFDQPGAGSRIERVQYYPEQDVMYIAGYTPDKPAPQGAWKTAGRVIARYENWSTQPRKTWEIYPRFEWHDDVPRRITPASFDVAGDLLFVIEGRYAVTTIYDAATGVALAQMAPGPEVGRFSGWIDIPYGINAMQRPDGEYLLLAEEDGRAKNLLYQFRKPDAAPPDAVASLTAQPGPGTIRLQWTASPNATGYVVERARQASGHFEPVACVNNALAWCDEKVTAGETFEYRVKAVGWGGASPMSQTISALADKAQPRVILQEDFERGSSTIGGVQAVPMPDPALKDGGRFVGELRQINMLPVNNIAVPVGATHLTIAYDRLFKRAPGNRVHTHYTRQFLRFNNTGEQRHGENQRFVLRDEDAGQWTQVQIQIAIPAGAAQITGGELANIAERRPAAGYDNPVYIDNLRIVFE